MEYYTYILQSATTKRIYYGQTNDIQKRLNEYNAGKSRYTKPYTPWELVAYKSFSERKEAMKFEKMLKNLHSRERVRKFIDYHQFTILINI